MTDGPFKSMTPDPDSERRRYGIAIGVAPPSSDRLLQGYPTVEEISDWDTCDDCGAVLYAGDWPWCGGVAKNHVRS